ncbi:hypothetical protein ONZ45_g608 [Pleurotus djamor]|nr:hypothetical protein ONZ45_g19106 [Pleurotus djamor]KAJ8522885.1 hypothetical protein ONZ45_g608 [Pleurotus djamor]
MLTPFTQTRYDLHDQRVKHVGFTLSSSYYHSLTEGNQLNKAEELRLDKNRKKFDIREEYFRLSAAADDEWESKRIKRPQGLPEWGVPPPEPPKRDSDNP